MALLAATPMAVSWCSRTKAIKIRPRLNSQSMAPASAGAFFLGARTGANRLEQPAGRQTFPDANYRIITCESSSASVTKVGANVSTFIAPY
jgi:hypothetical protein